MPPPMAGYLQVGVAQRTVAHNLDSAWSELTAVGAVLPCVLRSAVQLDPCGSLPTDISPLQLRLVI